MISLRSQETVMAKEMGSHTYGMSAVVAIAEERWRFLAARVVVRLRFLEAAHSKSVLEDRSAKGEMTAEEKDEMVEWDIYSIYLAGYNGDLMRRLCGV